jgi:microsomal dipeptidase-like Zn-dependent dipeptidase
MWGFTDLHAHPVTHLAFGADEHGNGGIFWGKPGLSLDDVDDSTFAQDLHHCDAHKHREDFDIGSDIIHELLISKINTISGFSHWRFGWPSFDDWPHPLSLIHQQMHISWIHRAYQGGLRLMIASVTDNQLLTSTWFHGPPPPYDPELEYQSARRQLREIRSIAENNSWMEIARDPDEAREIISERNHLALILSVEMDSLTADQIIALKNEYHVRQVIPIHLADNSFGGVAVYSDLFNTNNLLINDDFFRVVGDENISFRLGIPIDLTLQNPIPRERYADLGYEVPAEQGHKNQKGIEQPEELKRLMAKGLLIDLAHMSDASQLDAISLAEKFRYPVMNSHTGLRPDHERGTSERDMRRSLARRIGGLGGVIGLGTAIKVGEQIKTESLFSLHSTTPSNPLVHFWSPQPELKIALMPPELRDISIRGFTIRIRTGGDNLDGGENAWAVLTMNDGGRIEFSINDGAELHGNSDHTVNLSLPREIRLGDIRTFAVRTNFSGGLSGNNWNMDSIRVSSFPEDMTIFRLEGEPLVRFTGIQPKVVLMVNDNLPHNLPIRRMLVKIKTGRSRLEDGHDAFAGITLRDGHSLQQQSLNRKAYWLEGDTYQHILDLDSSITRSQLDSFLISLSSTGPNWFVDALDVEIIENVDPVMRWVELYNDAVEAMGGSGVVFGTDFNGFETQIPYSDEDTPTMFVWLGGGPLIVNRGPNQFAENNIDLLDRFPDKDGTTEIEPLPTPYVLGEKSFDFSRDGLAHYGLLPEFLEKATREFRHREQLAPLFHSAQETIKMWEKVKSASELVRYTMEYEIGINWFEASMVMMIS